jgi:hypothetical protein
MILPPLNTMLATLALETVDGIVWLWAGTGLVANAEPTRLAALERKLRRRIPFRLIMVFLARSVPISLPAFPRVAERTEPRKRQMMIHGSFRQVVHNADLQKIAMAFCHVAVRARDRVIFWEKVTSPSRWTSTTRL